MFSCFPRRICDLDTLGLKTYPLRFPRIYIYIELYVTYIYIAICYIYIYVCVTHTYIYNMVHIYIYISVWNWGMNQRILIGMQGAQARTIYIDGRKFHPHVC